MKKVFFDGKLILRYFDDDEEVTETREYDNGFLISLKIQHPKNSKSIDIIYDDVLVRLKQVIRNNNLDYKISSKGFGVEFNNGYQEQNIKLATQERGNKVLHQLFTSFDSFLKTDTIGLIKNTVPLTRRFQFVYPKEEDSLVAVLKNKANLYKTEIKNYVEDPKYILNKKKSDTLSYHYEFLKQALEKLDIVIEVTKKIENHYFDFLYRDYYYKDGVIGLNKVGTITYQQGNKSVSKEFNIGVFVDKPQNLLKQLETYTTSLYNRSKKYMEQSSTKILRFEKQEHIDQLDARIVYFSHKTDSLYNGYNILKDKKDYDKKDLPFCYKFYQEIRNRLIEDSNKLYIEKDIYDEKVEAGEELLCLFEALESHINSCEILHRFPNWVDEVFTVYQKNPFDERMFESKFLGNIERSGIRLYQYYGEGILRSTSCREINENYEKLFKLQNRLKELSDENNEETQRLNRALRRENVPARIERLLGL
jgi:hypothetical protein